MGLNDTQPNMQNSGLTGIDRLAYNAMFPQSQMDKTQYAVPSQLPTSAETISSDYDAKTDAYTGLPNAPFKKGGLAGIPRYNGEDGSNVQAPAPWDPASGQVTLQKYNTQDPSADPTQVAYSIPKDSIKNFVANTNDNGQADPSLGGQYILNDGSTMTVGGDGVVQAATPARSEYTLNKDGYYQPTGSGLTWNGNANLLTKNIGGVDVQVPGMYTKGGYQDAQGNLRTDANGVPIALAPNYLDSGSGKSGLADAAPYVAAGLMLAATGMPTGFEGMVPASETLMGGLGTGAATTAGGVTAAEGAGGTAATGAGGAAAGSAAANGVNGMNVLRGALLAKSLMGQLGGGASSGYSGQGLNPAAGGTGFNPGINPAGLPIASSYEKTPWANMAPPITLSKLSDFKLNQPTEMSGGGKAESDSILDGLTDKEKQLVKLELMAQSLKPMPGSEYLGSPYTPQGAFGKIGVSAELDDNSKLRAGLSGLAMAIPGQQGVKAMPGSMDIGYNTQAGPGNLDLSAFRSINPIPGQGHAQGLNARYTIPFAQGGDIGHLGGYSDGGRLLKGPGDGMSDNIPASIGDKQPARLADGEFVIPADVVSHLGNGSTDAGAKQLYAMMDRVRKARTGNEKQGKQIKPSKFLPKG